MKTKKEILLYYGMCCVSEYCLSNKNMNYPAGKKGEDLAKKNGLKIADICGQKKAIEFIIE